MSNRPTDPPDSHTHDDGMNGYSRPGEPNLYTNGKYGEPLPSASRGSDPFTSHAAEDHITSSGVRKRDQDAAVSLVLANPGKTSREIETLAAVENGKYRKRLNDEWRGDGSRIRKGAPRRCSVSQRLAETWWPVGHEETGVAAAMKSPAPVLTTEAAPC